MKARRKTYSAARGLKFNRGRLASVLLILALGVGLAFGLSSRNSSNKPSNQATSASTSAKGEKQQSASSVAQSDKSQTDATQPASGQAPKKPYGNFVSNHTAGFNDSEFSTCLTSAGVKCQITFSKDGVLRSLSEKTTDSDGAAYWTWKPQDLGLTAGSWKISATATSGGQTASADDSAPLKISP